MASSRASPGNGMSSMQHALLPVPLIATQDILFHGIDILLYVLQQLSGDSLPRQILSTERILEHESRTTVRIVVMTCKSFGPNRYTDQFCILQLKLPFGTGTFLISVP